MSQYYQFESSSYFNRPRITWAVQRLIFLNGVLFALQTVLNPFEYVLGGGIVQQWFGFSVAAFMHGFLWQPLTYQFLHGGLMHLFMNMLWLYFFGPDVERALGTRQFFRFYLFCGALGVMATFIPFIITGEYVVVVGASGAVMGVLVAFAFLDPERQFFLFPLPFPINARALVLIIIVLNVIAGLREGPVSVPTHFGGMAAGFLYMWWLPKINAWKRDRRKIAQSREKRDPENGIDKIGEAVDNIFKFEKKRRP